MKIIDKYLLKTFLGPLGYCLAGFSMIFVIFDLFDHFSDFMEAKTPLLDVLKYYMFLLPSIMNYIVPVSLLLSVLYALSNLTRNNELTAMRACGMSLYRLMSPFMATGFMFSLLVGGINEAIAPWSAYWTTQFLKIQGHGGDTSIHSAFNIAFKNAPQHRIWWIGEFNTKTFAMNNVLLTQQRQDGTDQYKIQAKEVRWMDQRWWAMDLSIQTYTDEGQPMGAPKFQMSKELAECNETPQLFMGEVKPPEFFSSMELYQYIHSRELSGEQNARHQTDLHSRLASPWTCLIVMLLGIPFGVHTGRKGAFLGIVFALALFFFYYAIMHFCLALGKNQTIPPWMGGWLPNIIFLSVGSFMVNRMR